MKRFDTEPIDNDSTVTFKGFQFRKVAIALGVLVILCLVVIIVLAIVLATEKNKNNDAAACTNGQSAGQTGGCDCSTCNADVCFETTCMTAASHMLNLVDKTASPCEDFHKFACGMFPQLYPLAPDQQEVSTTQHIGSLNFNRLRVLLNKPANPTLAAPNYDTKIKDFYASCVDHYKRTQHGAKPFLDALSQLPGGWWALDPNKEWTDVASWDLTAALKKTHVDLWTPTFFGMSVVTDQLDWRKTAIQIDMWGVGLTFNYYFGPQFEKARSDYKSFIRKVATLLMRDAAVNITEEEKNRRADQFVSDVYELELKIATIKSNAASTPNPHSLDQRMTLQQLTTATSGAVDFTDLLKYLFSESQVDGNTPVVVTEKIYTFTFTQWIVDQLAANATDFKRKLNSFIVWRIAYRYVQELSWDYTYAAQEFQTDLLGRSIFPETYMACMLSLENKMPDVLGSLFVQDHFNDANKQKAHEITDHVKTALIESLSSSLHWMSQETRQTAIKKLRESIMSIGYPDFLLNTQTLNKNYETLTIDRDNYFSNLLNFNRHWKFVLNQRFTNISGAPAFWNGLAYGFLPTYYQPWKELIVPAGILQFPIYDHRSPHYMNFGSMGSIVGKHLVNAVDEIGRAYRLDGVNYGDWWSSQTHQDYQRLRQCMQDALQGVLLPLAMTYYTPGAFAEASGVKVAYRAYKDWLAQNGGEKRMPGSSWTNEQSFFVAYAQAYCYSRTAQAVMYQSLNPAQYPPQENIRVNHALAQLPEFQSAFQCSNSSKMVASKRCQLY